MPETTKSGGSPSLAVERDQHAVGRGAVDTVAILAALLDPERPVGA